MELGIYEAKRFLILIELFFTFVFQHPSHNDEIVYYFTDVDGNEEIRHIYFTRKNLNEQKPNLDKAIFPLKEIKENIFKYLYNWIKLLKKIPYLENYIISYYTTNFIDQKVQGQLFLLNSFHPYFFGKKQTDKYSELIDRVNKQFFCEDDKNEIVNILKSKNGYGFRKMVFDLFERQKIEISSENIETLNSIRSSQAHGGSLEIDISEYIRYNELLTKLLLSLVKNVVSQEIKT